MNLILASQSIGRKKLLDMLDIPYRIVPSHIDEENIIGKNPIDTLILRAQAKAEEVVNRLQLSDISCQLLKNKLKSDSRQPTAILILSADSGAIIDDKNLPVNERLLGKPKDHQDGVRMLKLLSGRTHRLVTAVTIVSTLSSVINNINLIDTSLVTFRKLSDHDIENYLKTTDYQRFAGGYALFAHHDCRKPTLKELLEIKIYKKPENLDGKVLVAHEFITKIEGSLSNVIGLPLEKVIPYFKKQSLC